MIIVKSTELQKWTANTQAIVVDISDDSLSIIAPGPITAAAGAYKYIVAFGLDVDRVRVSKLSNNKWLAYTQQKE